MRQPNTQLVLRPPIAGSPPTPKIIYKSAPHETQYVIHQTVLGEFALCWSAHWLGQFFCVTDFPAEVSAYVHNVVIGPQLAAHWPDAKFNDSLDEVAKAGGPFSAVATALLRGYSAMHFKSLPAPAQATC